MANQIEFEYIVVGEELDPVEYRTDAELIAAYCRDWDDPDPLFLTGSSAGAPIVPPAYMAGLACFALLRSRYDTAGTLNAETEHENLKPLSVGGTLTVRGRVTDKFIRRGLEYVVVQSESYDDVGDLVRRSVDHIVLSMERR